MFIPTLFKIHWDIFHDWYFWCRVLIIMHFLFATIPDVSDMPWKNLPLVLSWNMHAQAMFTCERIQAIWMGAVIGFLVWQAKRVKDTRAKTRNFWHWMLSDLCSLAGMERFDRDDLYVRGTNQWAGARNVWWDQSRYLKQKRWFSSNCWTINFHFG